jgi:hypothetical protein
MALALILGTIVTLPACFGGGGNSFAGAATIRGTVIEFDPQATNDTATLTIEGVLVEIAGTDLAATTDENGFFIISGVPPGDHEVIFTFNGESAIWPQSVPANATVEMQNIQIDREEIIVEEVIIDVPSDTDETNPEGSKPEKRPVDIVDSVSDDGSVGGSMGGSVGSSVGGMSTVAKP